MMLDLNSLNSSKVVQVVTSSDMSPSCRYRAIVSVICVRFTSVFEDVAPSYQIESTRYWDLKIIHVVGALLLVAKSPCGSTQRGGTNDASKQYSFTRGGGGRYIKIYYIF